MAIVAEIIREATRKHLVENNGLLYGQCITAVGFVNNTVPNLTEEQGIIELPTSDASNSGIVCGAALVGRRPIYVIRYQGFLWYNAVSLINYAAKSKFLWDTPCPIFIRGIAMEGHIGPVAGGTHHSMLYRMPGIRCFSPMTPIEWQKTWEWFLKNDDPVFCSEHRLSHSVDFELPDNYYKYNDIMVWAIGASRFNTNIAINKSSRKISVEHIWDLNGFDFDIAAEKQGSQIGIVIDSDFQECGISSYFANQISLRSKQPVYTIGPKHKTAGFSSESDTLGPSVDQIVEFFDIV